MWGMLATALPATTVGTLRCQQTLGPLEPRDDGLWSPAAELLVPGPRRHRLHGLRRARGRVDAGDDGGGAPLAGHAREHRSRTSSTCGQRAGLVDVINLIGQLGAVAPGDRLIDVGSGSGWGSWLFAEAGYDPWMVDFEPNSLWLGGLLRAPALGRASGSSRDATLMPFADATFDIALVKEFAHHVDDKDRLFAEVNRVLRPGGLVVLIEPTHKPVDVRAAPARPGSRRGPQPARAHLARDLRARLDRNGMGTFWRGAVPRRSRTE